MHVAVTGASSGIGEAIAREFARAGAKLTLVARRREVLEKLARELGGDAFVASKDLSDSEHATDWIAAAEARHGPIDVLVNNAGMENTGPTPSADVGAAMKLLHTNLHTPLRLVSAVLSGMLARKSGVLVNVVSVAALAPAPMQAWYAASKAGLAAYSEALGSELQRTGVHVLTVYPGPVTTPMGEAGYAAFGGRKGLVGMLPEGKPDVLARRIRRAIADRKRRLIYPTFYWLTYLFPWVVRGLVDRAWLTGRDEILEKSSRTEVVSQLTSPAVPSR